MQSFEGVSQDGSEQSLDFDQTQVETEKTLVKYEADIRNHISIEQQLQIYIDSLKQRIEDIEKEISQATYETDEAREEIRNLWEDKADRKEEIEKLQDKIVTLKTTQKEKSQTIKSLEQQVTDLKTQNKSLKSENKEKDQEAERQALGLSLAEYKVVELKNESTQLKVDLVESNERNKELEAKLEKALLQIENQTKEALAKSKTLRNSAVASDFQ